MRPRSGWSSPAMARSNVVLPLPEARSSATTSPGASANETPFSTWFSPSRLWTSSTTSLSMEAYPEAQRDGEPRRDEDDVHRREGGDGVDGARRPERHDERAD